MKTYYQVLHENPRGMHTVPGIHAGVNSRILGTDSTSLSTVGYGMGTFWGTIMVYSGWNILTVAVIFLYVQNRDVFRYARPQYFDTCVSVVDRPCMYH